MADKKRILACVELKQYGGELQNLKIVKRKEVTQKTKGAREQDGLPENVEYDAAKDKQRDIELRIEELEKLLKNVEVVVEDEIDLDKISIGCKVRLLGVEYDGEMEFYVVGSTEANNLQNKINDESPVGHVLISKVVGDRVDVETQTGDIQYKVLKIQKVS